MDTGIRLTGSGQLRVRSTPIIAEPGAVVPEEVLVLYEYGGIEGLAVDSSGQPIPNANISVSVEYGGDSATQFRLTTDDLGEFVTLGQVPAVVVSVAMEIAAGDAATDPSLTWRSGDASILGKTTGSTEEGSLARSHCSPSSSPYACETNTRPPSIMIFVA